MNQGWVTERMTAVYNLGKVVRQQKNDHNNAEVVKISHYRQCTSQLTLNAFKPQELSLRKCRIKFSSSNNTAKQINKCANGRLDEIAQSRPLCNSPAI